MARFAAIASTTVLGIALVGAQGAPTDPALSKIAADFGAAVTAGNAAKTASFYTVGATFMLPDEPASKGRSNIQAWFQKQIDAGAGTLKLTPIESRISGDLAFESGSYSFSVKPRTGASMTDIGEDIVVLRKDGADSKMSHDIFNSELPPPPAK